MAVSFAALTISSISHQARAQDGQEFYAGPSGWRVLEQGPICALLGPDLEGEPRVMLSGSYRGEPILEISLPQPLGGELGSDVEMRLGNTRETLGLTTRRDQLALFGFLPRLADAFRRSAVLQLVAGDQVFATIPLTGSAAAYDQFEACRATLSAVPSIPPPPIEFRAPPRPPVPEPRLDAPLPPDRRVTPISPQNWITSFDYPLGERIAEGTTRYAAIVDANGRVRECSITVSSGYPLLDETTCSVISRHARFDPATDGKGNAIEARYNGAVGWQQPD